MSKALITGGAGFIGLHLARRLTETGETVDIADNFARGARDDALAEVAARDGVRVLDCDLLTAGATGATGAADDLDADYDVIYHCAARLGVKAVSEAPFAVLRDNVAMTEAALDLARRQTALRRFVFASTSEVYGGSEARLELPFPTPETAVLALPDLAQPRSSYMTSKIYGEALTMHAGVPYTIVRPHNIFGPRMGMAHVIPELLDRARGLAPDEPLQVYSVDHSRTFCYVSDAVEMIRLAAAAEAAENGTFNIGVETPEVRIGALAEMILEVVGKANPIAALPPTAGSPARRCPDTRRIRDATGYAPQTDLRDGVKRTYRWYQANVFAKPGAAAE